jgi:hypothetical protein
MSAPLSRPLSAVTDRKTPCCAGLRVKVSSCHSRCFPNCLCIRVLMRTTMNALLAVM